MSILIRENDKPTVYLIAGGAKFPIPSEDELFALGYTWNDVSVVPSGGAAGFRSTPTNFTLLRERDQQTVYCMTGGRALIIPTEAAFDDLGLTWDRVNVLPPKAVAGNGIQRFQLPSSSPTPSSMVFGPNGDNSLPDTRYARTEVPGITLPNGSHIVHLMGWLHQHAPNETIGPDPDFTYLFVPDPMYLEQLGADPGTFIRVGDILGTAVYGSDQGSVAVANPVKMKVEINGLPLKQDGTPAEFCDIHGKTWPARAVTTPPDWKTSYPMTPLNKLWASVIWPYVFLGETGNQIPDGAYVLLSGSLVTDPPHNGKPRYQWAADIWANGQPRAETNPSRWTEMHPPDFIHISGQQQQTRPLAGIVLTNKTEAYMPVPYFTEVTTNLVPPGPRPAGATAAIQEYVGPESDLSCIVEGNATRTGALLKNNGDSITVHIKVRAMPFARRPAKFKGVYRLWWDGSQGPG